MPKASCTAASKGLAATSVHSGGIGSASRNSARHLGRGLVVLRLQRHGQVDRMADFRAAADDAADAFHQGLHRREGGVVGQDARRERPDVAERHRAEAAGRLAADGSHGALHVQQRDPVEDRAAELDRRAVQVILVAGTRRLRCGCRSVSRSGHPVDFAVRTELVYVAAGRSFGPYRVCRASPFRGRRPAGAAPFAARGSPERLARIRMGR